MLYLVIFLVPVVQHVCCRLLLTPGALLPLPAAGSNVCPHFNVVLVASHHLKVGSSRCCCTCLRVCCWLTSSSATCIHLQNFSQRTKNNTHTTTSSSKQNTSAKQTNGGPSLSVCQIVYNHFFGYILQVIAQVAPCRLSRIHPCPKYDNWSLCFFVTIFLVCIFGSHTGAEDVWNTLPVLSLYTHSTHNTISFERGISNEIFWENYPRSLWGQAPGLMATIVSGHSITKGRKLLLYSKHCLKYFLKSFKKTGQKNSLNWERERLLVSKQINT